MQLDAKNITIGGDAATSALSTLRIIGSSDGASTPVLNVSSEWLAVTFAGQIIGDATSETPHAARLHLTIQTYFSNMGTISVNGKDSTTKGQAGGMGGSIYVDTPRMFGSGNLHALSGCSSALVCNQVHGIVSLRCWSGHRNWKGVVLNTWISNGNH